jgi:hypothetical protein
MKCGHAPSIVRRRGLELPAVLKVEGMIGVVVTEIGTRFCYGRENGWIKGSVDVGMYILCVHI